MANVEAQPISLSERIEVVDVLRGLAVCGILIGNMQWNSGNGLMPPAIEQLTPLSDRVTHYLVHEIENRLEPDAIQDSSFVKAYEKYLALVGNQVGQSSRLVCDLSHTAERR